MRRVFKWIMEKLLIGIVMVGMLVVAVVLFALPTYLPKLGEALTGGMPEPQPATAFEAAAVPYPIGSQVAIRGVHVSVADAFVCRSYNYVPPSLLSAGRTVSAKDNMRFVFVGLVASRVGNESTTLPETADISLICGSTKIQSALPTAFEPFSVAELRQRSRWFFFSFGSEPYHDAGVGADGSVQKRMGYVVFAAEREHIGDDCAVEILLGEQENTRLLWSLAGIER